MNKDPIFLTLVASAMVAASAGFVQSANPKEHAISFTGEIRTQSFSPKGKPQGAGTNAFFLSRQGSRWRLITSQKDGSRFESGSDGTNTFMVFHRKELDLSKRLPAHVIRGSHPKFVSIVDIPWLGLASDAFFQQGNEPLPAPWLPSFANPRAFAFKTKLETLPGSVGLPKSITFTYDLWLKRENAKKYLVRRSGYEAADLIARDREDGFVEAEFRILEIRSFHGNNWPISFELRQYLPVPARGAPEGRESSVLVNLFDVRIKDIQLNPSAVGLPELGSLADVADYRFRNDSLKIDHLKYSTNAWPTDTNDTLLQAKWATVTGAKDREQTTRTRLNALILVILFFPIVLFGYRKYKQGEQRKVKQNENAV
jgi:hypothetical protein